MSIDLIERLKMLMSEQDNDEVACFIRINEGSLDKDVIDLLQHQHREINGETDQQRKERKYRNAMFPQEDREPAPIGLKNKIKELEGDLSVMKLQRDAARDHEKRQEYIRKQQVRLIQKREAELKELRDFMSEWNSDTQDALADFDLGLRP